MRKKNITINDLAAMIQKGFARINKRFDRINRYFDKIEKRLFVK